MPGDQVAAGRRNARDDTQRRQATNPKLAIGASKITARNNQNNGKTEEVLDNRPREGLYS